MIREWWSRLTPKQKVRIIGNIYMMYMCASVAAFLVCAISGNLGEYSGLIKYKNLEYKTCLGGEYLSNYQIMPQIYNTSLTYYPAKLYITTQYWSNKTTGDGGAGNAGVGLIPAELIYPTTYMRINDCDCTSKGCERLVCDKMVGDIIVKYNELVALDEFPCVVYDGRVIGLAGEQEVIDDSYILSTIGICVGVLFIIITCMMPFICSWGGAWADKPTKYSNNINMVASAGLAKSKKLDNPNKNDVVRFDKNGWPLDNDKEGLLLANDTL